jgi:hypothetical protein
LNLVPRRHWTPQYVLDRVRLALHERHHPEEPWLTPQATQFLACWLRLSDSVGEFGSGRSTRWFLDRASSVASVEHDRVWFDRVQSGLTTDQLGRLRLFLANPEPLSDPSTSEYVHAFDSIPAGSLDLVLVDGVHRAECAVVATRLVRPGGIVVLDNSNWYLPSSSTAPNSVPSTSQAPSEWSTFCDLTTHWRVHRTSSGVTDTSVFFKPCG